MFTNAYRFNRLKRETIANKRNKRLQKQNKFRIKIPSTTPIDHQAHVQESEYKESTRSLVAGQILETTLITNQFAVIDFKLRYILAETNNLTEYITRIYDVQGRVEEILEMLQFLTEILKRQQNNLTEPLQPDTQSQVSEDDSPPYPL
jgi:hypothetical protein